MARQSPEQATEGQREMAARTQEAGLPFDWQAATYANTFDAHRLVHLAAQHGLATEAETRLMRAYFAEGVVISDRAELTRLGEEIGLDHDEVATMLAGAAGADEVTADIQQAQELGIRGVPFFVFDEKYAVSGAQPSDTLRQVLDQVWQESVQA